MNDRSKEIHLADFTAGDRVRYVPYHAHGNVRAEGQRDMAIRLERVAGLLVEATELPVGESVETNGSQS